MSIRVMVVEDNPQLRTAVQTLLNHAGDLTCVGAHASVEQAIEALPKEEPQAVLMDIGLPGMTGIEGVRRVKAMRPETQVIMLTSFEDPQRIFESLQAGATGYVLKRAPSVQILDAVRDVQQGGAPMTSAVARLVVEHFGKKQQPAAPEIELLSDRERLVLVALSEGQQYKEIATSLDISINTVRTYVRSIYEKLQVNSRAEAVKKLGRA
jgi:DNA-binding NarL/FixJ family response regulator